MNESDAIPSTATVLRLVNQITGKPIGELKQSLNKVLDEKRGTLSSDAYRAFVEKLIVGIKDKLGDVVRDLTAERSALITEEQQKIGRELLYDCLTVTCIETLQAPAAFTLQSKARGNQSHSCDLTENEKILLTVRLHGHVFIFAGTRHSIFSGKWTGLDNATDGTMETYGGNTYYHWKRQIGAKKLANGMVVPDAPVSPTSVQESFRPPARF